MILTQTLFQDRLQRVIRTHWLEMIWIELFANPLSFFFRLDFRNERFSCLLGRPTIQKQIQNPWMPEEL